VRGERGSVLVVVTWGAGVATPSRRSAAGPRGPSTAEEAGARRRSARSRILTLTTAALLGAVGCGDSAGAEPSSAGTGGSTPPDERPTGGAAGAATSLGGGGVTGGVGTGGSEFGGTTVGGDATGGGATSGGGPPTGGTLGTGGSAAAGSPGETGGSPPAGGTTTTGGALETGGTTTTGGALETGGSAETGATAATGGAGGAVSERETVDGVCARWNADRADLDEGTWSGSVAACDPGDISANGRANALRIFNLYRWLANLPEVSTSPELDAMAQACALLQTANDGLDHNPPETWSCWTELGAEGAATSNLSSGPGVAAADGYLIDWGNEATFGHRRIVLSNWLGPIGLGSTGADGKSCMQNMSGTGDAGREWTAWPPEGIVPVQAFAPTPWDTLDDTGWSLQSEGIDLGSATVAVTVEGTPMPVDVVELTGEYGARYGLRIVPAGWTTAAGNTYAVSVAGTAVPIQYRVQVVDCP
jgi:hypothetical protein